MLYTTPLSSMISGHVVSHHLYAVDSQLYVSFASGNSAAALNGLQSCLASVQSWMSTNKVKLNPDKTEFLLIGNKWQQSKFPSMFPIELFGVKTNPAKSAHNIVVIFDKKFTFRSHISAVCSSPYYHIRDLRHIHHYLDLDNAKLLAPALASNHFDYCNSLLYGNEDTDLTKLQRIQNQLAHLVTKSLPFTCSFSLLCALHCFPGRFRTLFKINLLTYKTLHEKQPVYIWPVVTELFPRLCCWTLIQLSRHWAWLRQGYWRYRSLIDWLIDWLIDLHSMVVLHSYPIHWEWTMVLASPSPSHLFFQSQIKWYLCSIGSSTKVKGHPLMNLSSGAWI